MRELLLIAVDGRQYGIWKDEVQSVRDLQTLHRLPLSPVCVAGMSIIDNNTVMLADLPVCIGHAHAAKSGNGRILLLSVQGKVTGFIVNGEIGSLLVSSEAVLPIPAYLTTPVISACAVHEGALIPIVNVVMLYDRMVTMGQDPPLAALEIPGARSPETSGPARVRIFALGDELYAASAADFEERSAAPGEVAGLARVPRYVKGITFSGGRVLPVIDLSQRIMRQQAGAQARILVAGAGAAAFGLLVDGDEGTAGAGDVTIKALPPIAWSSWLRSAAVLAGEIMPLIDLPELLSARPDGPEADPPGQRYTPDSSFPALFRREEVDVVEFSLLGARHALPESEVEDIIDFKPCRGIPDAPQIMIGVAEHDGELLPVLDLATVFGRRSLATPEWRMMLVKNGDFRALVITEALFGERRLSLDIQRAVPIMLPHRVVYGCYPDADAVRLVLNVEAVAAYFEKSLVKELLPALSPAMKQAPSTIIPSLLSEETGAAFHVEDAMTPSSPEPKPLAAAAVPAGLALTGTGEASEKEDSGKLEEVRDAVHGKEEPQETEIAEQIEEHKTTEAVAAHTPEPEHEPGVRAFETFSTDRAEGLASSEGIKQVQKEGGDNDAGPEAVISHPEEKVPAETAGAHEARTEQTLPPPGQGAEEASDEGRTVESAVVGERASAETSSSSVQQEQEPMSPEPEAALPSGQEPAPASSGAASAALFETLGEEKILEAERISAVSGQASGYRAEEEAAQAAPPASSAHPGEPSDQVWKRRAVYGAIGAVLIAVLYLTGNSHKPDAERSVKETVSSRTEPARTGAGTTRPAEKRRVPLVLEIPADRPTAIDVYVVKKGDTLWSISERFTGNPFNYPRIAGENRIADPDLIFPGQRIKLYQKAAEGH
jgi:chemotaxis signal transduction protein/nucleoid-associated protein YgaU